MTELPRELPTERIEFTGFVVIRTSYDEVELGQLHPVQEKVNRAAIELTDNLLFVEERHINTGGNTYTVLLRYTGFVPTSRMGEWNQLFDFPGASSDMPTGHYIYLD